MPDPGVKFQVTVEGAPRALHPIVEEEVCRIGEEAISNAFQHAQAANIDVVIAYGRSDLVLRVQDDGVGIDAALLAGSGKEGHFGLTGMRERAKKIRAEIRFESRRGAGHGSATDRAGARRLRGLDAALVRPCVRPQTAAPGLAMAHTESDAADPHPRRRRPPGVSRRPCGHHPDAAGHGARRRGGTGREAIELFRRLKPDVTLMDLQMPDMRGLDAIKVIRKEFPQARIIVLTTYSGDVQALETLKAGAAGYLLKSTLHRELLDTIRSIHADVVTCRRRSRATLHFMPAKSS